MFRNGTLDDCKAIYSLVCNMENRALPYDRFFDIFRSQVEDPNYQCIVFETDGAIVGFINLRYEYQLHHAERIAEVLELVVAPERRRQNIGKHLLAEAIEAARERDCSQIEVACNQVRKDSHRFYQREGLKNTHFKFSKRLADDADYLRR
jgi:PhnO protein